MNAPCTLAFLNEKPERTVRCRTRHSPSSISGIGFALNSGRGPSPFPYMTLTERYRYDHFPTTTQNHPHNNTAQTTNDKQPWHPPGLPQHTAAAEEAAAVHRPRHLVVPLRASRVILDRILEAWGWTFASWRA